MAESKSGTNTELALQAIAMENKSALPAESSVKKEGGSKFDKAVQAMKQLSRADGEGKSLEENSDTSNQAVISKEETTQKESGTESKEDWQTRYNNLQARADKVDSKAEKLARAVIDKNPDYIHELAKDDLRLANKIIEADLKQEGITTYEGLVKALKNKDLSQDQIEILERLEKTEQKLSAKEEADELLKIEAFVSSKQDINEPLAEEMIEVLSKTGFSLEEAYEFAKFKLGGIVEEKDTTETDKQEAAARLSTTGTRGGKASVTKLSPKEIQVLQGLGAHKTLEKYGITE